MIDRISESYITEYLDRMGALDQARQPGCYALRLRDPVDDPQAIGDRWLTEFDVHPPAGFSERAAAAARLCYVGSHGESVYARLCQHARGYQSSTIMELWPPVDVEAVWPEESPSQEEYNHATELADDRICVWTDGSYL